MLNVFSTALTALRASGTAIDVTGHNLANLNTTGFKTGTISFEEMVSQTMGSATEAAPNGAGVGPVLTSKQMNQGAIQVTGGAMDAAISGDGFFVVKDATGANLLTRSGNFRLDSQGFLTTMTGQRVQGWTAVNGAIPVGGTPGDIMVPAISTNPPAQTTLFGLSMNLNAMGAVGDTFSAPVQVVDSLGAKHTLTTTFTKSATNTWNYEVFIPGAEVSGGTAGTPSSLLKGQAVFDSAGKLTAPAPNASPVAVSIPALTNGGAAMSVNWNLYDPTGKGMLTQINDASALSSISADGSTPSQLVRIEMSDGGNVTALFSNGSKQVLAALALATVGNPEALSSVGDNNYAANSITGGMTFGQSGTGKRGAIAAQALEGSNVDMARELTNIIIYQRAYQANARVVSAGDELSQEVLSMKR
ncbi:MAG: flagellar hook protein FlgE [Bryobacterales bacterium]|nr:flagellar hook protein FlgE [Bryobacterales bacterium]